MKPIFVLLFTLLASALSFGSEHMAYDCTGQDQYEGGPFLYLPAGGIGGDEITLVDSTEAYELTACTVYIGCNQCNVNIRATLSIFENDGLDGAPNNLLWSGELETTVCGGFVNIRDFVLPNVAVAQTFTYALSIQYLNGSEGSVGLMIFNPPPIGSSDASYCWGKNLNGQTSGDWEEVPNFQSFSANFGIRFLVDDNPTSIVIPTAPEFMRGDSNSDGSINLSDAVFLLGYLFPVGAPNHLECLDASDADNDESVNIADVISLLGSLFGASPIPLPAPGSSCGPDASNGIALDCMVSACP